MILWIITFKLSQIEDKMVSFQYSLEVLCLPTILKIPPAKKHRKFKYQERAHI